MKIKAVNSLTESLLAEFSTEFECLFLRHSSKGSSFLLFLESRLKQARVVNVQAEDILYECFLRGRDYISSKEERIRHVSAWARSTCLNIIREKVRANIKAEKVIERLKTSKQFSYLAQPEDDGRTFEKVWMILKSPNLSLSDSQLLIDRFFSDMSISDIQRKLMLAGDDVKENTLRQRVSRALKRFRKIYNEMDS